MLRGLNRVGFDSEANEIGVRWKKLLDDSGAVAEPEYRRCFPDAVLSEISLRALEGAKAIKVRIASATTSDPVCREG